MRNILIASLLTCTCTLPLVANPAEHTETSTNSLSIVQRPETIRISEDGRIYVKNRATPLRQLSRQLQREGLEKQDPIYVSIPDRTPQKLLVAVIRELSAQGFRRVIFTKPPKAVAEASPE